jgi:acetyl esterase
MTTPVELGNDTAKPPLGIRLLAALGSEPAWLAMTAEDLRAFRDAENRKRMSRVARVITGLPDRRTVIRWQEIALADRVVCVRVHRPSATQRDDLPLVLHVHGGGFVGTAVQCDWVNSHLAARLPAVVVSVEHRLLAPGLP